MIKIRYSAVDGFSKRKSFKTLAGARKYAREMIGKHPSFGWGYAVSDDGVGKIEVIEGVALKALFGEDAGIAIPTDEEIESAQDAAWRAEMREQAEYEREWIIAEAKKLNELSRPARDPRCTCSDYQLVQVGCDCAACRGEEK